MEGKIAFEKIDYISEEQENLLLNELIDYIIWTKDNKDKLDDFKVANGYKKFDYDLILQFWYKIIGKPNEVEILLNDINVIADINEYLQKNYERIIKYSTKPSYTIFSKRIYRTEEQALKLKQNLYKLDEFINIKNTLIYKIKKNHNYNMLNSVNNCYKHIHSLKEDLIKSKLDHNHIYKNKADDIIRCSDNIIKYIEPITNKLIYAAEI